MFFLGVTVCERGDVIGSQFTFIRVTPVYGHHFKCNFRLKCTIFPLNFIHLSNSHNLSNVFIATRTDWVFFFLHISVNFDMEKTVKLICLFCLFWHETRRYFIQLNRFRIIFDNVIILLRHFNLCVVWFMSKFCSFCSLLIHFLCLKHLIFIYFIQSMYYW